MTRERRSQARAIPSKLGFIQISGDEGGRVVNISEAGLCFETFAPVERARRLQFWFSLNLRERVEASGRLAWLDAEGRVGGLRFLDLSAKARRHLYACLGASPGAATEEPSAKLTARFAALEKQPPTPPIEPQKSPALALQEADFVASRWFEASTAGPEQPSDPADRSRREETRSKGTLFFSALAAERTLRESTNKPETGDSTVLHEANSGPKESRGGIGSKGVIKQPLSIVGSWQETTSMVPLEWHLKDSRRQLWRGVLLGALVSLVIGFAGGRYFGRTPSGSEAGVTPAVTQQPFVAPGTQASSGASESPATGIPLRPVSSPQAPSTRHSPDIPQQEAAFVPSSSSGAIRRTKAAGASESRGAEAKATIKSNATPQQLWAAIQKGNTKAAVELADRFLQGDGVPVNCDQARVLFLYASEKNNADAIRKLHELDQTGCPKP